MVYTSKFGTRYNLWEYQTGKHHSTSYEEALKHPAIFPEKLAEDHIISWSNEGDTVLDPFLGSGTTALAAKNLKRNYIGIERELEYVEISKARLNKTNS